MMIGEDGGRTGAKVWKTEGEGGRGDEKMVHSKFCSAHLTLREFI